MVLFLAYSLPPTLAFPTPYLAMAEGNHALPFRYSAFQCMPIVALVTAPTSFLSLMQSTHRVVAREN